MPAQTRKITVDTIALSTGRAAGLVLGVVRLSFLARFLGLSNFGVLNSAAYLVSLFQPLFDLGLSQIVTRNLSWDVSRSRHLVGQTLILKGVLVSGVGTVLCMACWAAGLDAPTVRAIVLTTAGIAVNGITAVLLAAFQAHRRMLLVSVVAIVNDMLISLAVVGLLPGFPWVETVLTITLGVAVANLGILWILYGRLVGWPVLGADVREWLAILKEGMPIAVWALGISFYMFVGPTILRLSRTADEVGLFSSGYKIISILTFIPLSLNQVIFPIFSDFYANAVHKLEKSLIDTLRVLLLLALPLAAGTAVLGQKLFALIYTSQAGEFAPGILVLQILTFGIVFDYVGWILSAFLLATGRHVSLMKITVTTGLMASLAGFVAIPHVGYLAVPILTVATQVTLCMVQLYVIRSSGLLPFTLAMVRKPLLATVVMTAILALGLPLHLGVLVPLGVIVYFGAILLLKGLGDQERELLKTVFSKFSLRGTENR